MNPVRPQVRLDHLVLLAEDLPRTEAAFVDLGFQVTGGGVHQGGRTANRLVGLADGSYLELLTFLPGNGGSQDPPLPIMAQRFQDRAGRHGAVLDAALRVSDLDAVTSRLQLAGIALDGPFHGERKTPEGAVLAWRMAFPRPAELPFLIQDLTPWQARVPLGDVTEHANGVVGVSEVRVPLAGIPADSLGAWAEILGLPCASPAEGGVEVEVGPTRLTFRPPTPGNPVVMERYGVILRTGTGGAEAHLELAPSEDVVPEYAASDGADRRRRDSSWQLRPVQRTPAG